jgi:hypothetical protein
MLVGGDPAEVWLNGKARASRNMKLVIDSILLAFLVHETGQSLALHILYQDPSLTIWSDGCEDCRQGALVFSNGGQCSTSDLRR